MWKKERGRIESGKKEQERGQIWSTYTIYMYRNATECFVPFVWVNIETKERGHLWCQNLAAATFLNSFHWEDSAFYLSRHSSWSFTHRVDLIHAKFPHWWALYWDLSCFSVWHDQHSSVPLPSLLLTQGLPRWKVWLQKSVWIPVFPFHPHSLCCRIPSPM